MSPKNNINNIVNCYGCGVCAVICPKQIIHICLNVDGFYEPNIDPIDACVSCGLCVDVCSYNKEYPANNKNMVDYYAGWSINSEIRRVCSSGGVGFSIAEHLFVKGYKACGVRYDVNHKRAEHFIAENIQAYLPSIGSKYIQSYTIDGFRALNHQDNFLVSGTPCQIDSVRRYIRKYNIEKNYVLLDFFCHGVPSFLLWNKYVKGVEAIVGELRCVAWRNKSNGWHDSWAIVDGEIDIDWHDSYGIKIQGKKGCYYSKMTSGDVFYKFFLGNYCLGKACYHNCKYKLEASSADIRIGDLWGSKYKENQEGVSAVMALTDVGRQVLSEMSNCSFIPETRDILTEGQMASAPKYCFFYKGVGWLLKTSLSLCLIDKIISILCFPNRVLNKLFSILKSVNI